MSNYKLPSLLLSCTGYDFLLTEQGEHEYSSFSGGRLPAQDLCIDIEYNKRLDHRRPCLEDDLTAGSNL